MSYEGYKRIPVKFSSYEEGSRSVIANETKIHYENVDYTGKNLKLVFLDKDEKQWLVYNFKTFNKGDGFTFDMGKLQLYV